MKSFLVLSVACLAMVHAATIPLHKKALDPNHVPSSVCESMVPVHNDSLPSTDPAPYIITASKTEASPGETIRVIVSGVDETKFLGLYLQARVLNSGSEAVGKFSEENLKINPSIRISSCPPGSENAISYISRQPIQSIDLDWVVPENLSGKVYFRGTFVQSFSLFWVNVDSEPVSIVAAE